VRPCALPAPEYRRHFPHIFPAGRRLAELEDYMTRLVPRVVSSRRHDLALRTQLRPYAGETVTELVSQAGRSYAEAIEASRRSHVSAVGIFRPNHWRKSSLLAGIRLNCAKKTAYSAGYLMKRGREFKSRLDHHPPVPQFSDAPENRSKFARMRAISYQRMVRRAAPAALNAGIRQDLSAVDFARSTKGRSNFAFTEPFILPSS
jgi:hypothetical protein